MGLSEYATSNVFNSWRGVEGIVSRSLDIKCETHPKAKFLDHRYCHRLSLSIFFNFHQHISISFTSRNYHAID